MLVAGSGFVDVRESNRPRPRSGPTRKAAFVGRSAVGRELARRLWLRFASRVPPRRLTHDLRRGRVSIAGARYFLTVCTVRREPLLADPAAIERVLKTLEELSSARDADVLAATVMPDHVHVLFQLGDRLPLDRVVAKLKARARAPGEFDYWQSNYFEHRLRSAEDGEAYAWYVFMNPYAARLCSIDMPWLGWFSPASARWRFLDLARPGPVPQPEWLVQVEDRAKNLVLGGEPSP